MADYPCDLHGARYNGPSNRLYLTVFREDEEARLKGSLCGDCLATIVSDWMSWALRGTPGGGYDPPADDPEPGLPWIDPGRRSGHRNGVGRR